MTRAYVHLYVEPGMIASASKALANIEAVVAAHVVTGEWDIIVQIEVEDPATLPRVVAEEIHAIPGVTDTVTNVAYEY